MIDAHGNYVTDVPALTEREDGHTVTATITPSGTVTYTVDDGDGKRAIGEELAWDGVTCAHVVEQLRLVQRARRACEALKDARERIHQVYDESVELDQAECGRAETAHAQALVEYESAMSALPHALL